MATAVYSQPLSRGRRSRWTHGTGRLQPSLTMERQEGIAATLVRTSPPLPTTSSPSGLVTLLATGPTRRAVRRTSATARTQGRTQGTSQPTCSRARTRRATCRSRVIFITPTPHTTSMTRTGTGRASSAAVRPMTSPRAPRPQLIQPAQQRTCPRARSTSTSKSARSSRTIRRC